MEWTARKKEILKIVVERYIDTAEPVGSKAVVERMNGKISSATVRNELADLVETGYLEQPHTSAGRIPSPRGYRMYVNELMEHRALSSAEAAEIRRTLSDSLSGTEEMLARTGQMVSSFVGYPAYTAADPTRGATVRRFELLDAGDDGVIAVVMLSDSRVKSRLLRPELAVEREALAELSHLLNTHFTLCGAGEMNDRLMHLSDQVAPNRFLVLNRVVEYAAALVEEAARQEVFTEGASRLLKFPEYRDADKAHDLMRFMTESKTELPVPAGGASMQILIGPENVSDALKESSVIVASYDIGDNMRGLVGVVGPTRMDYATVAARLSYFAESLSAMFGKKNELPPKEDQT
ncbi:MAG: heat-inducible transcription repressor HrcA [Oscillospiraceae bacterium]|nr:heat-inducible transcription repressor HrcA [Oscillospiraceae bacterium]